MPWPVTPETAMAAPDTERRYALSWWIEEATGRIAASSGVPYVRSTSGSELSSAMSRSNVTFTRLDQADAAAYAATSGIPALGSRLSGITVTATARIDRIVWNMGDGTSVACGVGTPYADSYGKASSPDCGHHYTKQGRYIVTATSYWTVEWAGGGQSGSIPLEFSDSTQITMGEAQVLVQ